MKVNEIRSSNSDIFTQKKNDISGYKPNLDYIEVYRRTEQIKKTVQLRRFGIGLIGGYGVGRHGLSPYVGIGGYYRIW